MRRVVFSFRNASAATAGFEMTRRHLSYFRSKSSRGSIDSALLSLDNSVAFVIHVIPYVT